MYGYPYYHQLGVAALAPAPQAGEVLRTRVPDTMKGIKFELERMRQMVREAVGDPVVIDAARMVCLAARPKNKVSELAAIFAWAKGNFHYMNDPIGKEILQTPRRMLRQIQTPREVLAMILAPIYRQQMGGEVRIDPTEMNRVLPKAIGDCDEGATFVASLIGAVGILPRFRLGGAGSSLYHVWTQGLVPPSVESGVGADGRWIDMDITEERLQLGQNAPFEKYATFPIFGK